MDQELSFQDKYVFYRFLGDEQEEPAPPGDEAQKEGPDAHLRMVLRKR